MERRPQKGTPMVVINGTTNAGSVVAFSLMPGRTEKPCRRHGYVGEPGGGNAVRDAREEGSSQAGQKDLEAGGENPLKSPLERLRKGPVEGVREGLLRGPSGGLLQGAPQKPK